MPWVPLRVDADEDPGGGIVRVDVQVEGRTIALVLDTGAARTTIPARAGIAHLPTAARRSSGTAFGRHSTDRVRVDSLRFGGIEHGPLLVDRGSGEVGQLGLDVLGRYRLHLDLDGGLLGLDEHDHVGSQHPLVLGQAGHPHLRLHWGEVTAHAVLDTGASVTVVDTGFADRHPHLFTSLGASQGTDAAGLTQPGTIWTISGPSIDDLHFAPHTAAVVDLGFINADARDPVDLIVGYPLLRQTVWTLNLPEGTWSAGLPPDPGGSRRHRC
jgi:predicted aspartyl protease